MISVEPNEDNCLLCARFQQGNLERVHLSCQLDMLQRCTAHYQGDAAALVHTVGYRLFQGDFLWYFRAFFFMTINGDAAPLDHLLYFGVKWQTELKSLKGYKNL